MEEFTYRDAKKAKEFHQKQEYKKKKAEEEKNLSEKERKKELKQKMSERNQACALRSTTNLQGGVRFVSLHTG